MFSNESQRVTASRSRHPEAYAEYQARYREANRQREAERAKDWRRRNANRQSATHAAWRAENLPALAAKEARRRSAKDQATPSWVDRKAIIFMYEARAAAEELFGVAVDIDHIVPLVSDRVTGLHCETNLRLLLRGKNCSKSNRYWPDMWAEA